MFIHGDSNQTTLVAIAGVDPEPFAAWASKVLRRPVEVSGIQSLYNDPIILRTMIKELNRIAEKRKLQGFEKIKAIYLDTEPFTVENDLLTPTLKLKRAEAARAFRKEIDGLYERMKENEGKIKAKL